MSSGWRLTRIGRVGLIMGLLSALAFPSSFLEATTESQPKTTVPAKGAAVPDIIPLAEVATRATEVTNLLHSLAAHLTPSPEIELIGGQLPKFSEHVDLLLKGTTEILWEEPPLATLQNQEQIWESLQAQAAGWLKILTQRALQLKEASVRLGELHATWTKTSQDPQILLAPAAIRQQVFEVLSAVDAALKPLQDQLSNVLELQTRVAAVVDQCQGVLAQVTQAQAQTVAGILARDALPIWDPEVWHDVQSKILSKWKSIVTGAREDLKQYVTLPSKRMPLHLGVFAVIAVVLCAARRRRQAWEASGAPVLYGGTAIEHPWSAAIIGTAFSAVGPLSPTPETVQSLFRLAALMPMLLLIRSVVNPRVFSGLAALAVLYGIDVVRQNVDVLPFIWRVMLLVEAAAGFILIAGFLAASDPQREPGRNRAVIGGQMVQKAAILVLMTLGASFAAGILGYLRLANLLTSEILGGATLGLLAFAGLQLIMGMVSYALRAWPFSALLMVRNRRDHLERRFHRLAIWLVIVVWWVRWLSYLGLLHPALTFVEEILATNLERGSVSISLGDVLTFFLTVWVAYLVSSFIRFVLNEDVYPRLHISPGLSYAISNLFHYMILALGAVVGLGLMGIDLSDVTVLAGAFGVGIGFGLQSVVSNFVCGLILLFERPIHVGDIVEVGDLLGEVRRIGIRASTIRTRRGADIIVPNSQLVTEKLTNWTLSDKLRRLELPIGVNYGASPSRVIEILEAAARKVPRILSHPPPHAFFMSYGDSSINFELRAWTDDPINWRRVRSDLGVAAYDAVLEAGMSFPFPQREVRLLRDSECSGEKDAAETMKPVAPAYPGSGFRDRGGVP